MFEHHVFTLILHYVVPVLSPDRTKYWRLLCCGLVCQLLAHWLVSAQPLFPSVNSPLDHSALLLPPMPHIWLNANIWAGCLLAITMTHTSFTSNKSAQDPKIHTLAPYVFHSFFPQSATCCLSRHSQTDPVTLVSHPSRNPPPQPASLI